MERVKSMYWRLLGREADAGGLQHSVNNAATRGWDFVYDDLKNSAEGQRDWDRRNPQRVAQLEAKASRLAVVEQQLKDLQSRPPEVVVKEVEKIVEVIKEVEVGGLSDTDRATINETNTIVKALKALFERIFK